jgi:hypothetical protein
MRFREGLQTEQANLARSLRGPSSPAERERCATIALARLMFDRFLLARGLSASPLSIPVPDKALVRISAFFDRYRWRLDGPAGADEITPALLDCLLEKHTGRKQVGAYYTSEDVTGYMAANTIVPFLLDAVARRCPEVRGRLGGVTSVNELVARNLDVRRFAEDLIRDASLGLLRVYLDELETLTILDPTCGTGAFLRAAVHLLLPLYEACLERAGVAAEGRRLWPLQTILARNLYGVDLMPEAVEVCRLRLLLKLAARMRPEDDPGPLAAGCPNVRAGNALTGFGWRAEFPAVMKRGGFSVVLGNPPFLKYRAVRGDYRVAGFSTESCGNLFAFVVERALELAAPAGRVGMIVPVAATCAADCAPLRQLLRDSGTSLVSNFNDRPAKLFPGLAHSRLCIVLHDKGDTSRRTFSTAFNRWQAAERPLLFAGLAYVETTGLDLDGVWPKVGSPVEVSLLRKLRRQRKTVDDHTAINGPFPLYYSRKLSHFVQVLDFIPAITEEAGRRRRPSELKVLRFAAAEERDVFLALLNSGLFYWLVTVYSDCRNLNRRQVGGMPFDLARASPVLRRRLAELARALMDDLRSHAHIRPMHYASVGVLRIECLYPGLSKPLLDDIDRALAVHYGLSDEELEFLLHFDEKYRLRSCTGNSLPAAAGRKL